MPGKRTRFKARLQAIWSHFLLASSVIICGLGLVTLAIVCEEVFRRVLLYASHLEQSTTDLVKVIFSVFLALTVILFKLNELWELTLFASESVAETKYRLFARMGLRDMPAKDVSSAATNAGETSFPSDQAPAGSGASASSPKVCVDPAVSSPVLGLQLFPPQDTNQRGEWLWFAFSSNGWTISPARSASPRWNEPPLDLYQSWTE